MPRMSVARVNVALPAFFAGEVVVNWNRASVIGNATVAAAILADANCGLWPLTLPVPGGVVPFPPKTRLFANVLGPGG